MTAATESEKLEKAHLSWPGEIYNVLRNLEVTIAAYVPDGGHAELIQRLHDDPAVTAVPLTTEEEGVALVSGAWMGGKRGVLLMQSSGVGNCVNMLSLVKICRFPLLTLVTMRGEWGEFNPWQVPMGSATQEALEIMDVKVFRTSVPSDVAPTVEAAGQMAFLGGTPAAVLLSQRLIGAKVFAK
ncbi:phosphonopyruvate decarboxylase [Roseomonas nepalensis]|uniref:Phosphonopyruvate decarboxylase n=1 Tax=Muricoccus nepalensis TaxID=1854500 RepID=A0A502GGK3_9PROT|nr:thiamine pyrophosphate-binding protein [Roseomonas nepalensis]TPG59853.1 phosphonopyruvate decarboxylase [Roseomonas nepalensis]